jgi:ribonuclease D
MEADYQIIDTVTGLVKIVRILENEKTIAIDLEADSMFHFKEKVCLIQVASKNRSIVIDPLQIKDLSSLRSIFAGRDIQKIFHGADYDVRSLYRDFHIETNNLFDTELACRFLGIKETGLEAVLKTFFKTELDKKYQRKDWSKRPLPQEMLDYAARDVIYLVPLAEILEKELDKKGRLSWIHEECEYLSKVRPALSNDEPLFLKFKGAGRLNPRSLAVLESLLQFRKKVAVKRDKPLFKIIGNNDLMKITLAKPVTLRLLKDTKALSNRQISIYGNALVKTINKAIKIPEDKLPVYPHKKVPALSHRVSKRLKELKKWRNKKAKELEVDSAIICNNALLNSIAVENPSNSNSLKTIKNMKNWQKKEFGKEIIEVLSKVR